MPEQYTQQNSPLRFKAQELGDDDLLVTSLAGSEALSELYAFKLELLAPLDKPATFADVLGKPAVVASDVPGGEPRHFHGIVSRFAQGTRDNTFITYRAELVPTVWLLTKRTQSRIFQHISIPDILKKVFDGFDVAYQIQGTFEPRDYCVQYRETDFDFAAGSWKRKASSTTSATPPTAARWSSPTRRKDTTRSPNRPRSSTTKSRAATATRDG